MLRLTSDAGATSVTHGDDTFEALEGTDATFELPAPIAEHLLTFPALGWRHATDDDLPDVDDDQDVDPAPTAPPARRRRKSAAPAS